MSITRLLSERDLPYDLMESGSARRDDGDSTCAPVKDPADAMSVETALMRAGDGFLIAVYPESYRVDLEALEVLLGSRPIRYASREEIERLFPESQDGCVPSLGCSHGIRSVIDIHVAGSRRVLVRDHASGERISVAFEDFESLEYPIKGRFAVLARSQD